MTQRLNVYNQQNGDKAPQGAKIAKWNPCTPPADLASTSRNISNREKLKSVSNHQAHKSNGKETLRLFTNTPTKTVTQPNVNHLIGLLDNNTEDVEVDIHPVIFTFISESLMEEHDNNAVGIHDLSIDSNTSHDTNNL